MTPIQFTISGQPVSMKNQRKLVTNWRTGKPMFIKSKKALQYESDFLRQIPWNCKIKIEVPVKVTVLAYYGSRRPDLDCELICDCLQKGEVLKNDRLILDKHFQKRVDKKNPRCEIKISNFNLEMYENEMEKRKNYLICNECGWQGTHDDLPENEVCPKCKKCTIYSTDLI